MGMAKKMTDVRGLDYSKKWLDYGFLKEDVYLEQFKEFKKAEDKNTSPFRLESFSNWLSCQKTLNITEIEQFLELAKEDKDQLMAGTALKALFVSEILSDNQFKFLKRKLPEFGEWTKKFIAFTDLNKRLEKGVTPELYLDALSYKKQFRDSRPLVQVIKNTNDVEILSDFKTNGCGKQLRTMAEKRLNRILKES